MTVIRPTMKRAGQRIGTFVKTPAPQVIEVLGRSRLDFAVLDAEHAPLDRATIDLLVMAGWAAALPLLVRIADCQAATIQSALDVGAAGVLVPHVDDAETARQVVARTRHRGGCRGFSGSPRFAGYGSLSMRGALEAGTDCFVMCQIESTEAVAAAGEIALVDGVDGLFIGYADLALSMGLDTPQDPRVAEAAAQVVRAGRAAGKTVGMFVGTPSERDRYAAQGVELFVISSDQSLLRLAADALVPASI